MTTATTKAFRKKCEAAASEVGVNVSFYENEAGNDQFGDDGYLHITKNGFRACFDVGHGQSLEGSEQNKNTRAVMNHLGMESKISDRVLVEETDEDEDEDDECPHCGRSGR